MKLFLQPTGELSNENFKLTMEEPVDIRSLADAIGPEFFEQVPTRGKTFGIFGVDKDEDFNKILIDYDVVFCGNNKLRKVGKTCWKMSSVTLARKLWNNPEYKYIYIIENPVSLDIELSELYNILEYKEGYKIRSVHAFGDDRKEEVEQIYKLINRPIPGEKRNTKKEVEELAFKHLLAGENDKAVKHLKTISKKAAKGHKFIAFKQECQTVVREKLLGEMSEFQCAICKKILPVDLIGLYPIKPNAVLYLDLVGEIADNYTALCELGCAKLFTQGYLVVNLEGVITRNESCAITNDYLLRKIYTLTNKTISQFNNRNSVLFAEHMAYFKK